MVATSTVPRQGSVPQAVAVLAGVVLTLLGALSFLATGFDGFAAPSPQKHLFGLTVNPLQNVLHLTAGLLGIVLSKRLRWTRLYGLALVAAFAAVFGYGVVAVYRPAVDVLNAGWAANWLHLGIAVAGLVIAAAPARVRVRVSRSPR
jgi:hypothetical protein